MNGIDVVFIVFQNDLSGAIGAAELFGGALYPRGTFTLNEKEPEAGFQRPWRLIKYAYPITGQQNLM